MKIIRLQAENLKRLVAVDITPTGNIVEITGKNASGKTSTIDAIWWALAGTSNIQGQPIRQGEKKARIRLDLGEIIVERRFTENGSSLIVESVDGARYPSPQKMLDALIGELSFDPLAFARAEPRKQFDQLRQVAKLEIDVDALDAATKADFANRTDVNRQAKQKRIAAEAITVPKDLPPTPVDESALVDQIQAAADTNAGVEVRKARRESAARDMADRQREAREAQEKAEEVVASANKRAEEVLKREAKESGEYLLRLKQESYELSVQAEAMQARSERMLIEAAAKTSDALEASVAEANTLRETAARDAATERAEAEAATAAADAIQAKLDAAPPLPEAIDVADLRARLTAAKTTNEGVAKRTERAALVAAAKELEAESEALTEAMAEREKAKANAIKAAVLPVEGIGFGDGIVLYNGVPFDQASSAEQLRVSLAVAMAANPKLRVLRIQDGSLLDEDNMAAIEAMAKAGDYQVWVEEIGNNGRPSIEIRDGMVARDGYSEVAE